MPPVDRAALAAELAALPVVLTDAQIDGLAAYAARLWAMNARINLTRHTDVATFVARDVRDAVHLAHQIPVGQEVLDVGSGGGAPAVPLAILRPDLSVTLTESVGKKARALASIVAGLPIDVTVVAERAESALEDGRYDTLTVRAVGSLAKLCEWFHPYRAVISQILALKGPKWVDERGEARHLGRLRDWNLRVTESWTVPGSWGESVLLRIWEKDQPEPPTPAEPLPPRREALVAEPPAPDPAESGPSPTADAPVAPTDGTTEPSAETATQSPDATA